VVHRYIGNIYAPNLIAEVNLHAAQQVFIFIRRLSETAEAALGKDGNNHHLSHQAAYALWIDRPAIST
jgi:hypothetical protein